MDEKSPRLAVAEVTVGRVVSEAIVTVKDVGFGEILLAARSVISDTSSVWAPVDAAVGKASRTCRLVTSVVAVEPFVRSSAVVPAKNCGKDEC